MTIGQFFHPYENQERTHSWLLAKHDSTCLPTEDFTKNLAEWIMLHRCRGCPNHYDEWKRFVNGGPPPSATSVKVLRAFTKPIFGLPDDNGNFNQDHLEGSIAQYLWYFLSSEGFTDQNIVRLEPPGFSPTDHGGDGLVIIRTKDQKLRFRLWEIKKSTSNVGQTVGNAYSQLNAKATEYLARYTVIGQELPDPELSDFYGRLPDLWIDAKPEASIGVSISLPLDILPVRCFYGFKDNFPRLTDPIQLRGLITAIHNFSAFSINVRNYVWTGL
jgi:hypothetical protein